jgi:hypothetical protein
MTVDRAFIERNRASRERLGRFAALSEEQLRQPVGEHWTVAITLAHLAFWDRRVSALLETVGESEKRAIPRIDISVNDFSLPLWAAIPPREAGRLAMEAAQEVDAALERCPVALLERLNAISRRFVERSLHRNDHLDEAAAALGREPSASPQPA